MDQGIIVRTVQTWHDSDAIELQPGDAIDRFRVLKKFPQGEVVIARFLLLSVPISK